MKLNLRTNYFLTILLLFVFQQSVFGQDWEKFVNLGGYWKFSIGDDFKWANNSFDDKDWEEIKVPSPWEDEGFHGYNGYAWYRKHFKFPDEIPTSSIYLLLGTVDDVDQTYINGKLVGSTGSFPPDYQTGYYDTRKYPVPVQYLNKGGDNVIAVRVYDSELEGGIIRGDIGLFVSGGLITNFSLEGQWKFRTGDNKEWGKINFNDEKWNNIIVPGFWEPQGYNNYDGFAWYRKTFKVPNDLKNKKLVLVVGKIDDLDEVYLNGELIGATGEMKDNPSENHFSQEYQQFRGYYIPDGLIKNNEYNVVAVRVFDGFKDGGIYEGPIGLVTQERYIKYWRSKKDKKNIFDILFNLVN
jgi:Beta-galactosidase second all-beta domain